MDYSISKEARQTIILCSAYLIIYHLIKGFSFLFADFRVLDNIENGIVQLLYVISYIYILYYFFDYFRHYALKVLQSLTLIILSGEVANQIFKLINSFHPVIPGIIFSLINGIIITATIIWIIYLFKPETKDLSAIDSLRKYGYGIIASFILGIVIMVVIISVSLSGKMDLVFLPLFIPYIFSIDFALKLSLKKQDIQEQQNNNVEG